MPRRASKAPFSFPVTFQPTKGVNYGVAPIDLKAGEVARSMNGYYPKQSNRWTVRPGFECVTDAANKLDTSILKLVPYYNGTTQYLVCASGGKLYAMSISTLEGATPAWAEVGSLTDSTTKPSMITYNGLLLIADGGTAVRYWDGTTYGTLTNSPENCTALAEVRGRVAGNSATVYDYVYLSAAEFPGTDWQFNGGHLEIAAGFGDGIAVNGFAVGPGGRDLIISKRNEAQERAQIRRLIMEDASPTNWYVSDPTEQNTGSQTAHGMLSAFGRTYYFDDVGIRALSATDSYAQVEPDPHFGRRLNRTFDSFNAIVSELSYLPTIGAMALLIRGHSQPYLYFPRNDAFSPWRMSGAIINTVATLNGNIYMGAEDGNLYRMNDDIDADEVQPGETPQPIQSFGRSRKVVAGGYDVKLTRLNMALTPIRSGTITMRAVRNDEATQVDLATFDIDDGVFLLGLAVDPLGEATGLLGQDAAEPAQQTVYGGPRSKGLQIEWYGNGARYEVEQIAAEFAGPLGG